jgi:hypothetical protein
MDRSAWYGLQLGLGLSLIFIYRRTKVWAYLIIGILLIVLTLATILLRALP